MDWSAETRLPCPQLWVGRLKLLLLGFAKSVSPGSPTHGGQAQLPTQEPWEEPGCWGVTLWVGQVLSAPHTLAVLRLLGAAQAEAAEQP